MKLEDYAGIIESHFGRIEALEAALQKLLTADDDHMTACDRTMGASHACTCGANDARRLLPPVAADNSPKHWEKGSDDIHCVYCGMTWDAHIAGCNRCTSPADCGPTPEQEKEIIRFMSMSEDEIRDELIRLGECPDEAIKRHREAAQRAIDAVEK
jgi:hypothetical protein